METVYIMHTGKKIRFFGYIVFLVLLCSTGLVMSCAGAPQPAPVDPVYLTNTKAVRLLPTDCIQTPFQLYQNIEGHYNSQTYRLVAIVSADKKELSITALSDFGVWIYDLLYRTREVVFHSAVARRGIRPEYMIADFQLCYYPAFAVKDMLQEAGLRFEEQVSETGFIRMIFDGDTCIIEIKRQGSHITYENLLRKYGYTIQESEAG